MDDTPVGVINHQSPGLRHSIRSNPDLTNPNSWFEIAVLVEKHHFFLVKHPLKQLNTYKKALVLLGFLRKLVFEVSSVGVLLAPQALEKERDQHAEAAKRHQEQGMQWGFNHHEIMEAPW